MSLIPFYIDLKKESSKKLEYETPLQLHIFFSLNFAAAIQENNYDFIVIESQDCPFLSWLESEEGKNLLKEDYNLIKISHEKIHKIPKLILKSLKKNDFITATNLYNEMLETSLTILSYIRAHRESFLIEKKEKLQEVVRKLRKLSEHDLITGLHNEFRLNKIISIQLKAKNKFYIAVFDIDDFRYINQVYGYKIGNLLLEEIAHIIKEEIKNKKIQAFKVGSNTFITIIFEKNPIEFIKNLKQKIENVQIEKKIEGHSVKFFPKITAAYMKVDKNFSSADEIVEMLEIVLHRGKIEKRGGIVEYNSNLDSKLEVAKLLDKQIFLGISVKERKIIPYFQPIFDIKTGKIFAYGVLFRIKKGNEIIPTGQYIDIAYKTGLILEIDKLIFEYLIENKGKLQGINLFVNTSQNFIKDTSFKEKAPKIENAIFEITEQVALENTEIFKEMINNHHIKMALDDFGSGYSSIKTVVELATNNIINYLKIDGSLIKDILKSKENFYIVESVVKMAKTLGLKTVAEFIENEEILKTVKNLGVDYAQGFYLGIPKPIEEIMLLDHFYNKEFFLKQFKKEIARVKRYNRVLALLKVQIKRDDLSDDDIFNFVEKISKNLRMTDLFVKWNKNTLFIVAPEINKEKAIGIKNKIFSTFYETFKSENIEDINVEIFQIDSNTKIEDESSYLNGLLNYVRK
jgi:diguanylate cyclase (GGDEF)-like protein